MNAQLSRELSDAAVELEQDPEINAIVLSGAGRAFSAGADIKEMARLEKEPVVDRGSNAGSSTMTIASGAKPVIAAINGLAFGGGALLASAVDIRFGCEKSRFRFLGVRGRAHQLHLVPFRAHGHVQGEGASVFRPDRGGRRGAVHRTAGPAGAV